MTLFGLCHVNVGVGGTVVHVEGRAPPPGAKTTTAAVADVPTWRPPPPQKVLIIGVKKVNVSPTLTLIRLPAPVPPCAAEQANGAPALSVHDEVAAIAPSPR